MLLGDVLKEQAPELVADSKLDLDWLKEDAEREEQQKQFNKYKTRAKRVGKWNPKLRP